MEAGLLAFAIPFSFHLAGTHSIEFLFEFADSVRFAVAGGFRLAWAGGVALPGVRPAAGRWPIRLPGSTALALPGGGAWSGAFAQALALSGLRAGAGPFHPRGFLDVRSIRAGRAHLPAILGVMSQALPEGAEPFELFA